MMFEKDNGFHTLKKYIYSVLNHTGNGKTEAANKDQHKNQDVEVLCIIGDVV